MKKLILISLIIMLAIAMLSGNAVANAMGDENYNDHSADETQPGNGDIGPGEPNDNISPSEDRTRNKDA
ncbi:hypothetical protein [Methanolobus psychrotolerans]|uniref:hypothetical protein n=1 Tax=Methanolobus psychrotolerans TaxID=1874706 RepID=UPI000B9191BE|nr:hypothetical protein [Methanolobus psychrotolerans]